MITIFKDIHSTSTPYFKEIEIIIERIKNGQSKELITKIRSATKEERNHLKKSLPSICFSGKFSKRNAESCLEHSGYICLDFDAFPNEKIMNENRAILLKDKYTHSLFISPGGDGLKLIVKIPAEMQNHKKYFDKLKEYYNSQYFDSKTSDICRVCYESYDPDLYFNKNSSTWTDKEENEHYSYNEKKPLLPIESSGLIIQKLQKWFDGKYSVTKGQRNANLFILASSFNEYGINENEARSYLLSYRTDDFSQREIDNIVKSAYSKSGQFGSKYFEDNDTRNQIRDRIQSGRDITKIYKEYPKLTPDKIDDVVENIQASSPILEFWYFDKAGKCRISNLKFKTFLEQNGFCKYYHEGAEYYIFIKIENTFIENTNPQHIKDFVLNYLINQDTLKPYEFMASATKYFKEDYLSLIKVKNITLYEDDVDYMMLYFLNCAVKVYKNKIEKIDYLNLNGMVWKRHVINRNFEIMDFRESIFDKFIGFISGSNMDRSKAMRTVIGYLMHSHKTSANNKAIILNDETISENPNGGSGKGIIINALTHMKRICILDGKQFDFNKAFPYQTVSADTQVLVFDDVKKNFNFEGLFSLITEGITLEKKNKDAIKIPVKKSPKIVISTNYTVGGVGGSFDRRKLEVELSAYFNINHTPYDEFGLMLFDEFCSNEWTRFDNYMIHCSQEYLESGLMNYEYANLKTRKFISDTSFEFFEWVQDNHLPCGERLIKNLKFDTFCGDYPDNKKLLSQKKFARFIDCYGIYLGKKVISGNSQGSRWVQIGELSEPITIPF